MGAVGAVIGSVVGEGQMQRDLRTGHVVKSPSFWNESIIIGAGVATMLAGVVAAGAIAAVGITTASALATSVLAVPILAGAFLAPVIGGIIGGNMGKERLTREYNDAQAYVASHSQQSSLQESRSKAFGVTPNDVAIMESRFANNGNASMADKIMNQSELATAQSAAR